MIAGTSGPDAPPRPALLAAVALVSAAVLGFEVALTRVFAVLLWYHFAFLVISVALCGLGVGGYAAHWLRRRRPLPLATLAALFGVTLDLALVVMLRGVFPHVPEAYWVAALLVLVPFACAGAFLAEVFVRYPAWSGRLYAWDLAGAAVAALGIVGLLQWLGAIDACLAVAAIGSVAGFCVRAPASGRPWRLVATVAALVVVWGSNRRLHWLDVPPMPPKFDAKQNSLADRGVTPLLFTDLGTPGNATRILDTRWNAFARTDVVADPDVPDCYVLYTNGNVPSILMHWDGRLESIAARVAPFALSGWSFDAAPIGTGGGGGGPPRGRVFSIGPGGGLDALLALQHGAERFDGAEINPSIVALMAEPKYREMSGDLYQQPEVHVVTAEGRACAREAIAAGRRYDLIFLALTKTAAAGQGMAMVEAFIYTQNAFEDYFRLLEPDGQLTIVADEAVLLSRFMVTGLAVLRAHGIREPEAMRHVALVHDRNPGPYMFSMVLQKSPFSSEQTAAMAARASERRLTPIWIPGRASWREFLPCADLADGKVTLEQFVAWTRTESERQHGAGYDIRPCPDDCPFVLDVFPAIDPVFKQMAWVAALLGVGVVALGWTAGRGRPPREPGSLPADVAWVAYFLALGAGFLLVEIPLTQKLILPLGYPTLALTVILFSILLGGGAGAFASQRFEGGRLRGWAIACALAVAAATVVGSFTLDALSDRMLTMSLAVRCALAIALLLPLGFLLGTPFPSGIRLFAARRAAQVPLMWGLNGVASVIGSLCAAIGAKSLGFNATLRVGAAVYGGAALLLLAIALLERRGADGRSLNVRAPAASGAAAAAATRAAR